MANISPLFKGGDVTVASNYRPVSLLPIVSRLLEKFVQQRLMSFLGENNLLPDSQFAYRKNHSTEDAITLAVNRWLLAKHQRRTTGIVFVNMSKAFDRVRHDLLISDLAAIGVHELLSWLCYDLSDKRQRVRVGDNHSDYATCSRGVPEGSVLGPPPLLFVIYISKLVQCLPAEVSNQEYADDIMLECTHLSPFTVCRSLSTAVTALGTWLEDRGLLINDRKTQVMILQPRGASASPPVLRGDELLPTMHSVRYLGVIIDDGVTWNGHVDKVTKEARKATGALW